MTINERIKSLRKEMSSRKIDAYLIPSGDFHQSEYVNDFFKCREFISGFTGSSGTALITLSSAHLWTDGRYFIQAENQLLGTEFILHKQGLPDTISIDDFLLSYEFSNKTLAFDGRILSANEGLHYKNLLAKKGISIFPNYDLINTIWTDRPQMSQELIFRLEDCYAGETTKSKLSRLREEIKSFGATWHLLASLDDIAWLFNLRGNDITYTPVFLSFALISNTEAHLFVEEHKLAIDVSTHLKNNNVTIHPYDEIYQFVEKLADCETLLIDPSKLNYKLYQCIVSKTVCKHQKNPTTLMKAQKNEVEIANIRLAHIRDAVAHTKFLYWLKTNFKQLEITELSASEKLEEFQKEQENYLEASFAPISAYGPHGAICHYSATPDTNIPLKEGSFYLIDSGVHYLEGSTDTTRTIALGEINNTMKHHYTAVLRGNLALSNAKFLYGCTGENLDILARQFLWSSNLDYMHGTGHGIGNLLSVHEGPCNIKWKFNQEPVVLEPGMILSNEPGLYLKNHYGIRLENNLLVSKGPENEYGQFMCFETLTCVPFDMDAIDFSALTQKELTQLHEYHAKVYELVSPHLCEHERNWLKKELQL